MLSLSERLAEINKLRQHAMADPEFIDSAKSHEVAIQAESDPFPPKSKPNSKKKRFASVYKDITFGAESTRDTH